MPWPAPKIPIPVSQVSPRVHTTPGSCMDDARLLQQYVETGSNEAFTALGTAEEAARKRVSRAVEKLRDYFGVSQTTLPSAMMSYFLFSKLAPPTVAPPLLADAVATLATQPALIGAGAEAICHHVTHK